MSALGQKRTLDLGLEMSRLALKADILSGCIDVCLVPSFDSVRASDLPEGPRKPVEATSERVGGFFTRFGLFETSLVEG
jgi:hypothetical protein